MVSYRARNQHGDGPASDPLQIIAATVPDKIAQVVVSIDTATAIYRVGMESEPNSGGVGVPFTAVEIQLQDKDGNWVIPTACASSQTIIDQAYCELTLAQVTAELKLVQSDPLLA
jgi:hypothetical protein